MALDVELFGRNLQVTERIQTYVMKKVSKLDRFLSDIDEARVDLGFTKSARNAADRHVAQITLRGRGFILRSEERADDLFTAIDAAVDKMERQIERYKGKRNQHRGDGKSLGEAVAAATETPESSTEQLVPAIVRRKRFTLVPMDEAEAIEQMSLLGHEDFFVFYNVNTNAINILYTRRDGTYGLIEPEVG